MVKLKSDTEKLLIKTIKKHKNSIHLIASENIIIKKARFPYKFGYVYDIDNPMTKVDKNSLVGNLPIFNGNMKLCDIEKMQ